jgi:hypothetical protein
MKRRMILTTGLLLMMTPIMAAGDTAPPEGFKSLFNGKDLTGWKVMGGNIKRWGAENGVIFVSGSGGGWLMTEAEFANFELRAAYRWEKLGGNSGVALRAPDKGDPAYVGMEIQLIDDEGFEKVHKYKLQPWQKTGSVYDVEATKLQNNKPIGEWNTIRIVCNGRHVTVELNGKEINKADLDAKPEKFKKHPGLQRKAGHVGFQSHDGRVEFRNIWIKVID